MTLAEDDRQNSSLRKDVDQTTDVAAFGEMFDYIKSDKTTLDMHKDSEVASFYAGRILFITGASGFVGKVSSISGCSRTGVCDYTIRRLQD